jgi:serine/threonine protein kinase
MDATQAETLAASLTNTVVGGWNITGYIGRGKSAVVLHAQRDSLEAAIKVFHPELIERYGKDVQLERILREKSLVGATHPNLVQILDGGECETTGHLFVVMEYLPCKNLHERLKDIPTESIPSLIAQLASAARFLEDRNLAHRDIKPENVAITDDNSRPILLDLGVLRPIGNSNLTDLDQRSFIGTLRYSSPEFLARLEEDNVEGWRAVTFYQLGAVLHDLLMGRVLFQDESEPFARLVNAVQHVVPEIHATNTNCVALANHCLSKNPKTRLQLVSWQRFHNLDIEDSESSTAVLDRIAERQKYFQATVEEKTPEIAPTGLTRVALDDVCNRLETRIATLMNGLQTFPLRTTHSVKDVKTGVCATYVHFEQDDLKGLPFQLSVFLKLEFLDQNAGSAVFRITAASTIADHETLENELQPHSEVHIGELQTFLDGPALQSLFLEVLDGAYAQIEAGNGPKSGEALPIAIKGTKND